MMYNTKDSKERNEPEKKEACTAAISRAAKKAHPFLFICVVDLPLSIASNTLWNSHNLLAFSCLLLFGFFPFRSPPSLINLTRSKTRRCPEHRQARQVGNSESTDQALFVWLCAKKEVEGRRNGGTSKRTADDW